MLYEWGRFVWWVQQGGNSNILLVAITSLYVLLTYRILKWSTLAAREALQPKLNINFVQIPGTNTVKGYRIQNVGEYSVMLLDVRFTCYENGRHYHHDQLAMDTVLVPNDPTHFGGEIDFTKDLSSLTAAVGAFSYWIDITVSDSLKRFAYTYRHGYYGTTLKRGKTFRVWYARALRPFKTRYHRFKSFCKYIMDEVTKVDYK